MDNLPDDIVDLVWSQLDVRSRRVMGMTNKFFKARITSEENLAYEASQVTHTVFSIQTDEDSTWLKDIIDKHNNVPEALGPPREVFQISNEDLKERIGKELKNIESTITSDKLRNTLCENWVPGLFAVSVCVIWVAYLPIVHPDMDLEDETTMFVVDGSTTTATNHRVVNDPVEALHQILRETWTPPPSSSKLQQSAINSYLSLAPTYRIDFERALVENGVLDENVFYNGVADCDDNDAKKYVQALTKSIVAFAEWRAEAVLLEFFPRPVKY